MMEFERSEWGGRFPDREYSPMYLGNGVDAMLINLLGAGMDWRYAFTGRYQQSMGWYKNDRRTKKGASVIYGMVFSPFEFSTNPLMNGDEIAPFDTRQYFDPERAKLTTFYEQKDNETEEWLRVRVTTFLTKDHVLVEHSEILEAPAEGIRLRYHLSTPTRPYLDLHRGAVQPDESRFDIRHQDSRVRFDYVVDTFRGGVISWFDKPARPAGQEEVQPVYDTEFDCLTVRMDTAILQKGDTCTRFMVSIDNWDSDDYSTALEVTTGEYRQLGVGGALARHEKDWRDYFSTCWVNLPDPALEYLHSLSRYVGRANHYPAVGYQPVGILPYLWQGTQFWDAMFIFVGMLTSGNVKEADEILGHINNLAPLSRALAQKVGGKGQRLEWTWHTRTFDDYSEYIPFTKQFHNNSVYAYVAWLLYEHTGELEYLERYFTLMGELLLFMVDFTLEYHDDYAIIGECEGIDESVTREKINDTWTCAITLRGLEAYREAAMLLQKPPCINNLDDIIDKLEKGLNRNVDEQGIMQSFQGGKLPHWGSLIFDLFPDHPSLEPTIAKMMENYDPVRKLYNFHAVTRYAEKGFPWCDWRVIRELAQGGSPVALELLDNVKRLTTYFGGISERVFYHGEYANVWFSTAHGALVWAVNSLLANAHNGKLRILAGAWTDAEFSGVLAGDSLEVSASVCKGKLTALIVKNLLPEARIVYITFGASQKGTAIELYSGDNILDPGLFIFNAGVTAKRKYTSKQGVL